MHNAARRFRGLFACEQADNPLLIVGLPDPNLGSRRFLRQVEK